MMKTKTAAVLWSGFWLLSAVLHTAGQELPRIKTYTRSEYLGKRQNWDIDQLSTGIICVANSDGLLTFDGYHWNKYSLTDGQILRTIEVKDDTIFGGAYGEFGYWALDRSVGSLAYSSLTDSTLVPNIDQDEIWNIVIGADQSVYAQSFGRIFRKEGMGVKPIYPTNTIRYIYPLDSQLVLQVKDQGLSKIANDRLQFLWRDDALDACRVKGMVSQGKQDWLIGTENNGLFQHRRGTLDRFETEIDAALGREQINKLIALRGGLIAVGTILNGLYILDEHGKLVYHFNKSKGLLNNTVLALFEDIDGNLWVGLDDGLAVIEMESPIRYWYDIEGELGTPHAACEYNGMFYIGTNHGLFVRPLQPTGKDFSLIAGTQGQVWELKQIDDALFCAHNMGVFKVSGNHIEWISEGAGVYTIERVNRRPFTIITGTYSGINVIEKKGSRWQTSRLDFDRGARWISVDATNNLWISSASRGLFHLQIDSSSMKVLSESTFPIFRKTQPFLGRDERGNLYASTDHQLYQWQDDAQQFAVLDKEFIHHDQFLRMLVGRNGWTFLLHRSYTEMEQHGVYKGRLPLVLDGSSRSIIHLSRERYFLTLSDGYAIVNCAEMENKRRTWTPQVTKLEAYDKRGKVVASQMAPSNFQSRLTLPNHVARIRIHYANNSFYAPSPFRHQLIGFDEGWSQWEQRNMKEYTNLPPGEYHLKLASEDKQNDRALVLTMHPKWYQTKFIKVLAAITLLCSVYLIYLLYQWRIRLHKRKLKIEHERRLNRQLLEMKAQRLEADVLTKSKELANSTMNLVQKNEVLYSILKSLREVKKGLGVRFPDKYYHNVERLIQRNLSERDDWQLFETNFNGVHEGFFAQLRKDYPDYTR